MHTETVVLHTKELLSLQEITNPWRHWSAACVDHVENERNGEIPVLVTVFPDTLLPIVVECAYDIVHGITSSWRPKMDRETLSREAQVKRKLITVVKDKIAVYVFGRVEKYVLFILVLRNSGMIYCVEKYREHVQLAGKCRRLIMLYVRQFNNNSWNQEYIILNREKSIERTYTPCLMVDIYIYTSFTASTECVVVWSCLIIISIKYLFSPRSFVDPRLLPRNQSSIPWIYQVYSDEKINIKLSSPL